MSRHEDTLLLPPNTEITEIASGTKVSWPGTDAQGNLSLEEGEPCTPMTPTGLSILTHLRIRENIAALSVFILLKV